MFPVHMQVRLRYRCSLGAHMTIMFAASSGILRHSNHSVYMCVYSQFTCEIMPFDVSHEILIHSFVAVSSDSIECVALDYAWLCE